MIPTTAPDELAMVRARIAQLQAREAALCTALVEVGQEGRRDRWAEARVIERRLRLFDHRLLPPAVQADSSFWRERTKTEIELNLRSALPSAQVRRAMTGARAMDASEAHLVAHLSR